MDQQTLQASSAGKILAIVITFPILALITVILRLYTRFHVIKSASSEDYVIVAAIILSIGVTISTCYEVRYGLGRHTAFVGMFTPQNIPKYLQALFSSIIVYNFALFSTKLSILLQYLRICSKTSTRRAVYVVIAIVSAYCLETFFTGLFTCTPVAFFWDSTIPNGKCLEKWPLYFANAAINIATDFMILLLPIFILKDLMMPKMQKYFLMAIIALGGIACIASIFRLHELRKLSKSVDPFWDGPGTATWSAIEINVGIICASVSTLRPLAKEFLPNIFGSGGQSYGRNKYVTSVNTRKATAGNSFYHGDDRSEELKLKENTGDAFAMSSSKGNIEVHTQFDLEHSHV